MLVTLAEVSAALPDLSGLGAAGVMGAMWLWERRTSHHREQQLNDAHARILSDRVQLEELIRVVQQNTEAFTRLSGLCEQSLRELNRG